MSSNFFSPEWVSNAFSNLWSLHLAMMGSFVSIFTLLYSFIISKKDYLKLLAEQIINKGDKSPTVLQKQKFAVNYITRMSTAANYCLFLLVCSIILAIGSGIGIRFPNKIAFFIIVGFTILIFIPIISLGIKVFKQYRNDIKI